MVRVVVVSVPAADAELAADRMWIAGARAIEERQDPDGRVELRSVLAAADDVSTQRLGELPGEWRVCFVDEVDRPAASWRDHARPIEVNERLVIRPAWLPPVERGDVLEIAIEPAASFGLGDHPTTQLSARVVDRLVARGDRVLDVGCGSGVLAVLAALRGASEVVAIDVSDAAIEASIENAVANGVSDRVTALAAGVDTVDGSFDVVVANILAPTLVSIADDLVRLTARDGRLVISGVLAGRHDHVLGALQPMCVAATAELDGWAAVELHH